MTREEAILRIEAKSILYCLRRGLRLKLGRTWQERKAIVKEVRKRCRRMPTIGCFLSKEAAC